MITRKRLLLFGLAMATAYWSAYAYRMAVPGRFDRGGVLKGGDYEHFYVLGQLALRHEPHFLYDRDAQLAMGHELVGSRKDGGFGVPARGPQVSLLFSPLARLAFAHSLLVWWSITAAIYFAGLFWVLRQVPTVRKRAGTALVVVLALAFPGFQAAITWGQVTALGLGAFLIAGWAFQTNRPFVFGLAIGGLFYKPPLGILAAVVLIARREWTAVAGATLCCAVQLAIAVLYYGDIQILGDYAASLGRLLGDASGNEPLPEQMHSLRAFWMLLAGRGATGLLLYVASAVAVTAVIVRNWVPGRFDPLTWSAFITASILVDPHVTIYDLIVLLPVFILVSGWILAHDQSVHARPLALLLVTIFVAPFLGASLTVVTRVQLSVIAMVGLVLVLTRATAEAAVVRATDRVVG